MNHEPGAVARTRDSWRGRLNATMASAGAAHPSDPTVASAILAVASWQWLSRSTSDRDRGLSAGKKIASGQLRNPGRSLSRARWLSAAMFGFGFIGHRSSTRGGNVWMACRTLAFGERHRGQALSFHSPKAAGANRSVRLLRHPVFSLSVATSIESFRISDAGVRVAALLFRSVLHRSQVETGH